MITHQLKAATEIPIEIVEVVKGSVINVFASIAGDSPSFQEGSVNNTPLNGMIGNIAVFNPEFTFSLMLALPKQTAVNISEAFLGMELPIESEDMGDLIAELSNILAGEVAANIENVSFRGQSSLPMATRGSDLRLFMPNKPPSCKMEFASSVGDFILNMALTESQ
jgi:CheY-specific phosphatase CheX